MLRMLQDLHESALVAQSISIMIFGGIILRSTIMFGTISTTTLYDIITFINIIF